ncbi:MAG: hypothetical protein HQK81_05025 [Desulfovibrionaceae bacterium]|nr:hypothetical protein [Desulfovibrionaceae bacterium]MBF0513408.1 hypothetical protein [Desulfovibrionaceae bacterium]
MPAKFAAICLVAMLVGFIRPVYSQDTAKPREDGGKITKNVEKNPPYLTGRTVVGQSRNEKKLWRRFHGSHQGENKDQPENVSPAGQAHPRD